MEKKKEKKFLKVLKGIVIGILAIILIMNVYVIIQTKSKPNKVPSIFGYKPFIVLSGSMESKIKVGDLVFVKEVDSATLKVDDIIAFRDEKNVVTTHRIINIVNTDKGACYETKGDNNNTKDENMVCADNIEGRYQGRIAKVGSAILFVQQPLGFAVMMLSLFIVCIFIYWFSNRDKTPKLSDEELKEFEEFKKNKENKKVKDKKEDVDEL